MVERLAEIKASVESPARIETHVREALTRYRVTKEAFRAPPDQTIKEAVTLLDFYQMDPKFYEEPRNTLFAVAAADQIKKGVDEQEENTLQCLIQVLAVGPTHTKRYTTQSGLVNRRALMGEEQYKLVHPEYYHGIRWSKVQMATSESLISNQHPQLTERATEEANRWGRKTRLQKVRDTLNITQENEKHYSLVVVDKSEKDMQQSLGIEACYTPAIRTIILPHNYKDYLEHEYAHSQGSGISIGYRKKLFAGLNEAFTEWLTKHPRVYYNERIVLKLLMKTLPAFDSIVSKAYREDKLAQEHMITSIVHGYGFEGLLSIARMLDYDTENTDALGKRLHVTPEKTKDLLEQKT